MASPAIPSCFPEIGVGGWPEVRARPLVAFARTLDFLRTSWGLGGGEWSRLPGGEDCAAFALGDLVVKLVPPEEHAAVAREAAMLARVAGVLPVPVPRLWNRHEEAGWTALLLSRIPGVLVAAVWADFDEPARERLLTQLGEVAAAMRRVPLATTDPRPDLAARSARHGPDAAAWISRWLTTPEPVVFVHGDLTDQNVLVELRGGQWELSGVLDFAGAFAAAAPLELVSPGVFMAQGRPHRLAALARGAGIVERPERRLVWHLLHPYGQLRRDLTLCGLPADASISAALEIWR